jgi:hypothetical protein
MNPKSFSQIFSTDYSISSKKIRAIHSTVFLLLVHTFILIVFPCIIDAQLVDHSDIRIFASSNQQSEVHISINKNNPQNLIISSNTFISNLQNNPYANQGYYYSLDGGITWNGADMLQNSWLNSGGDPSTGFDNNGRVFIAALKYGTGEYFVQTSTNGGITWSNLVSAAIESGLDKQLLAIDNVPTSPFVNNFY